MRLSFIIINIDYFFFILILAIGFVIILHRRVREKIEKANLIKKQ